MQRYNAHEGWKGGLNQVFWGGRTNLFFVVKQIKILHYMLTMATKIVYSFMEIIQDTYQVLGVGILMLINTIFSFFYLISF